MKKTLQLFVILLASYSFGQVGIGTTTPDTSASLDITSTTSGILIPRMTEAERDLITVSAARDGLLIYQTNNSPGFYYYDGPGAAWTPFGGVDNDWTMHANGTDMFNANTGNVGVGNTNPSANFHITGTTVLASLGGLTTLYENDFESGTVTNETGTGGTCVFSPNIWHIAASSPNADCTGCTTNRAFIQYSGSCNQNETLVEGAFTPTTTSINISFAYQYNDFTGPDDSFEVILRNNDTNVLTTLIGPITTDTDTTYSQTIAVLANNSYSLRFTYRGIDDLAAAVDNILVTETQVATSGSYVFRLEDGQQQNGYVLTTDANGNASWQPTANAGTDNQTLSISGSDLTISNGNTITIPSNTYNNGLTLTGTNAQLGGALINDTTIDLGANDLTFGGASTGYLEIQGNNRRIMRTRAQGNYVSFGDGSTALPPADNTSFDDTGGVPFTIDFAAGFWNDGAGGTAIEIGSVEYIVDGSSELFFSHGVGPLSHLNLDLGADGIVDRYWDDVYARRFVASSATIYAKISGGKKAMKGLSEIMQLNPFVYREKSRNIGSRMTTPEENGIAIGFDAKELLQIIPEAVKTSDWYTVTEGEDMVKKDIKNPSGIMYNQLIPVAVKAIQEQQEQIETLKEQVALLKEAVKALQK